MEEIKASLKYGRYYSKDRTIATIVFIVFCFLLIIAVALAMVFGYPSGEEYLGAVIGTILCFAAVFGFLIAILIRELVIQSKAKKEIKKWSEDFILTHADACIKETHTSLGSVFFLVVTFKCMGQRHRMEKILEKKVQRDVDIFFYHGYGFDALEKCTGDHVPIYYSPKYNEIVFLK